MSKTKKLIASALAIVSLAAVPSTSIVLSGSGAGSAAGLRKWQHRLRVGGSVRERGSPTWGSSSLWNGSLEQHRLRSFG